MSKSPLGRPSSPGLHDRRSWRRGGSRSTVTHKDGDNANDHIEHELDDLDDGVLFDPDAPDPEEAEPTAGDLDLAARLSLRRVPGMSTEVADISQVEYRGLQLERVVLVGVWTDGTQEDADNAMTELKALAETAGSQVLDGLMQRRHKPDPATYIGRGKVDEVRDVVAALGADTVICDGELTPAQLRNLEDRVGVKVVDRTALDPGHLRPTCPERRGQDPGRVGSAAVSEARLRGTEHQPVASGGWSRLGRCRNRRARSW